MVALSSFCAPLHCIFALRMHLGIAYFVRIHGNISPIAYSVKRVAPDTHLNLFANQGADHV